MTPSEPLAFRMRPRTLDEFIGQEHLLAPGKPLRTAIEADRIGSMILWGPPGSGKTTLAHVIAKMTGSDFVFFSAVLSGIKDVREAVERAQKRKAFDGGRTILFVDEIHRFNKAQQDAFLPHVESGVLTLIGATTENPSFEVNNALLSRTAVHQLQMLTEQDLIEILRMALTDTDRGLGEQNIRADDSELGLIAALSNGDARRSLSILEVAAEDISQRPEDERVLTADLIRSIVQRKTEFYDKSGEEHFNLISALHKSLRGSDPDAALYWLYRMIESGEDPMYLARRMVRFAVEDIGLADPRALTIALAAKDAYHFLGSPEGDLALAEAAVYMAAAPKSNAIYKAEKLTKQVIRENPSLPVPLWIRNAVTRLMQRVGYGRGYQYPHDHDSAVVNQEYLPDPLVGQRWYHPTDRGLEERIAARLEEWRRIKSDLRTRNESSDSQSGPEGH
ncbi:MAG: AAA family ATPase [candidate division Zixibacteria bacterium]|nr:AAA family ATPase [candidate division Zixibacteria bacterium]